MKPNFNPFRKLSAAWTRGLVAFAGALMVALGMISCSSVNRSMVMLPEVPGAKYIGSKECEQCHEEIYRNFQTADHARLISAGPNALNAGCESCHGPASLHAESGGETKTPYNFTAGRPVSNRNGAQLAVEPARSQESICYQCHTDVRGQFNLPSHHPVPEGRLTCTQCHLPHKGSIYIGGGTAMLSESDSCLRCHAAQKTTQVFEHPAMREGCTICHTAHGSPNAKLLTVRNANLCIKCHFQEVSGSKIVIGGSDHTLRVQQGTCWTAGCHEAVHGSRVSPSLRF